MSSFPFSVNLYLNCNSTKLKKTHKYFILSITKKNRKENIYMSIHNHNTTSSPKNQYHHLTKDDRVKIETLISLKDENR